MSNIPVIAFAAYSGTGKTTLIEKLVAALKGKGLRLAVIKHDGHKFEMVHDVDLILVEGYKNADLPQIGIARKETGKGFTAELSRFIALVSDYEELDSERPCFGLNDIEEIAEFILRTVLV